MEKSMTDRSPGQNALDSRSPDQNAQDSRPPDQNVRDSGGTLERGLAVLRTLAGHPGLRMRAGDLVRATGLARSTVDRIVSTLARVGYLRLEERDILLAPRLMELGNAYLAGTGLPHALDDLAAGLADELDESVSIAVPDHPGVRFVGQYTRRRTMSVAFRIGDLLPATRCAAGTLFAAEWPQLPWFQSEAESDTSIGSPCTDFARGRGANGLDSAQHAEPSAPCAESSPQGAEVSARRERSDFERRVEEARKDGWAIDDQL